jgi:hypothetical protein
MHDGLMRWTAVPVSDRLSAESQRLVTALTIDQTLVERRSGIVSRWFDIVLSGHPESARSLLKRGSEPFVNPMASIVEEALEAVYAHICGAPPGALSQPLDRLMRLRALDGPDVSDALSFLEPLRALVRAELSAASCDPVDIASVEARVDDVAGRAADRFADARRALAAIRDRERQDGSARLIERLERYRAERNHRPWQP